MLFTVVPEESTDASDANDFGTISVVLNWFEELRGLAALPKLG